MRRKVKGRPLPTGTTRTLANGLYPFGWVRLRLCTWQEWEEGLGEKREHDYKIFQLRNEARERAVEQIRNREQERLEQERREAEAKEAQAKREAELEAMSDEERLISLLENNEATENQVVELFFKLDSLDEALKLGAAKASKASWKAEKKKWSGKLSPKQKTKVAKIKAILGEE